jgi:hypothetical protein
MSEEHYTFPPYEEKMREALKPFNGKIMDSYNGMDVRPLQSLQGKNMESFKFLYKAPKLDKIVFAVHRFKEMLMSYATIIWPDDEHALPIFQSYWAESAKGSYFIIDFYPTADCIVDDEYLALYLAPLEDLYEKGITIFPDQLGRSRDWFRALISPYCLNADLFPSTRKTQDAIIELTMGYLAVYIDLWKKDEKRNPAYMKLLNQRKEAIRKNFKEKDPGAKMMELAVGHEMAELSLRAIF